jgi:hypothetical protein
MEESKTIPKQGTTDAVAPVPTQPEPSSAVAFETIRWTEEKELKEKELQLQREQMRWSRWGNPAFVAIVAGLIGYLSTLFSSYTTRQQEVERQKHSDELEQKNREATLRLEREKQEGTLILEAIKTGGSGANKEISTAANLIFLADAGLITSINKEKLARLREIAGEALPSLPGPEGVEFQPSTDLTKDLQSKLTNALTLYQAHLAKIGYAPNSKTSKIGIRVDRETKGNAYFDDHNVVLGSDLASDPEYALSEYTWQVLRQSNPAAYQTLQERNSVQLEGFAYGLKFYFVCSYFDEPRVGKNFYALSGLTPTKKDRTYLFDLKSSASAWGVEEPHELGEIWGSAFWEIRQKGGQLKVDQLKVDKLILTAWQRLKFQRSSDIKAKVLIKCVLDTNEELNAVTDSATIREAFERRNLR